MESSHWTTDSRFATSEAFDYDLYVDHDNPIQLLTPPDSRDSVHEEPSSSEDRDNVSISTTFFPGAHVYGSPSDLILVPNDSVYFYVHAHILLSASENGFNSMLPVMPNDNGNYTGLGPILPVPERSSVLNVVLHAIYDMSCARYSPSFDTLVQALSALRTYGVAPKNVITSSNSLYHVLLTYASSRPLDLFALAAEHNLNDLAIATSAHLLSISLSTISDEMATRMGPIYLKRLFFMHLGRAEVLRSILLPPPYPHAPTAECGYTQQNNLTRAWTLASAYLAWDARADLSTDAIEAALTPLGDHLSCGLCRTGLTERIQILTMRWSTIKRTIQV